MKTVSRLITAFLLACILPAWAAPVYHQDERKSYEEMTPQEIKAEVKKIEDELVNQASRLVGVPFGKSRKAGELQKPAAPAPEKREQLVKPGSETTNVIKTPSRKPVHKLHRKALVKSEIAPEKKPEKTDMHALIKKEAAKIERVRQKQSPGKNELAVVRLPPSNSTSSSRPEEPKVTIGDDGKREIELELPLPTGKGKHRKKEKVKVRIKPEVMAIHRQIQGLNQMLIDDVVRMTGKPLQKKKNNTTALIPIRFR